MLPIILWTVLGIFIALVFAAALLVILPVKIVVEGGGSSSDKRFDAGARIRVWGGFIGVGAYTDTLETFHIEPMLFRWRVCSINITGLIQRFTRRDDETTVDDLETPEQTEYAGYDGIHELEPYFSDSGQKDPGRHEASSDDDVPTNHTAGATDTDIHSLDEVEPSHTTAAEDIGTEYGETAVDAESSDTGWDESDVDEERYTVSDTVYEDSGGTESSSRQRKKTSLVTRLKNMYHTAKRYFALAKRVKHLLHRFVVVDSVESDIRLGLLDPVLTGKIFGALAALNGVLPKRFKISPSWGFGSEIAGRLTIAVTINLYILWWAAIRFIPDGWRMWREKKAKKKEKRENSTTIHEHSFQEA